MSTATLIATHNFEPEQDGDLELRKGDIIHDATALDADWSQGTVNGKQGRFPTSYTRKHIVPKIKPMLPNMQQQVALREQHLQKAAAAPPTLPPKNYPGAQQAQQQVDDSQPQQSPSSPSASSTAKKSVDGYVKKLIKGSSGRNGFLYKKGGAFGTKWQERYFVLNKTDHMLAYFKTMPEGKDDKPTGVIDLAGTTCNLVQDNRDYCFCITVPGKAYLMAADTEDERDAWVTDIKSAAISGNVTQSSLRDASSTANVNSISNSNSNSNTSTTSSTSTTSALASSEPPKTTRVYFRDDSFKTFVYRSDTNVLQLKSQILKKLKLQGKNPANFTLASCPADQRDETDQTALADDANVASLLDSASDIQLVFSLSQDASERIGRSMTNKRTASLGAKNMENLRKSQHKPTPAALRIYFKDKSWKTVAYTQSHTVRDVIHKVLRKIAMPSADATKFALNLVHTSGIERQLQHDEVIASIVSAFGDAAGDYTWLFSFDKSTEDQVKHEVEQRRASLNLSRQPSLIKQAISKQQQMAANSQAGPPPVPPKRFAGAVTNQDQNGDGDDETPPTPPPRRTQPPSKSDLLAEALGTNRVQSTDASDEAFAQLLDLDDTTEQQHEDASDEAFNELLQLEETLPQATPSTTTTDVPSKEDSRPGENTQEQQEQDNAAVDSELDQLLFEAPQPSSQQANVRDSRTESDAEFNDSLSKLLGMDASMPAANQEGDDAEGDNDDDAADTDVDQSEHMASKRSSRMHASSDASYDDNLAMLLGMGGDQKRTLASGTTTTSTTSQAAIDDDDAQAGDNNDSGDDDDDSYTYPQSSGYGASVAHALGRESVYDSSATSDISELWGMIAGTTPSQMAGFLDAGDDMDDDMDFDALLDELDAL